MPIPPVLGASLSFPYLGWTVVVLIICGGFAAYSFYLLGQAWPSGRLVPPALAVVVAVVLLVPGPPPDGETGLRGTVDGRLVAPVEADADAPVALDGDGSVAIRTVDGTRSLVVDCPDNCTFRAGSYVEPRTSVSLASTTVELEGGPVRLQARTSACSAAPWILYPADVSCSFSSRKTYRAPSGVDGTVELNMTGGVAA